MNWTPKTPEIEVPYPAGEYDLYRRNDSKSKYKDVRWPLPRGRGRHGEFPLVVVREHYRTLDYEVYSSEPELPDNSGFILVSYPGKRRRNHPAYTRMEDFFGKDAITKLNKISDQEKHGKKGSAGGGDPDLFVFNDKEHFFVEVKDKDSLNPNQLITFPIIENCLGVEIRVARIIETKE